MKNKLVCFAALLGAVLNSNQAWAASPAETSSRTAPAAASSPAVKAGLTVVVEPTTNQFEQGEPLGVKVTFENTSKEAFRLPDQVKPAKYNYWELQLTNVQSGKVYSGVTWLPMGA